ARRPITHTAVDPERAGGRMLSSPASRFTAVGLVRFLRYRTTPAQRVWCVTPPTTQLTRKSTELPAATVPLARMLTAVARTSGAAWAANGVTVPVAEMPPTETRTPVQPAG